MKLEFFGPVNIFNYLCKSCLCFFFLQKLEYQIQKKKKKKKLYILYGI